jgi:hypothetical protein
VDTRRPRWAGYLGMVGMREESLGRKLFGRPIMGFEDEIKNYGSEV